MIGALIGGIGLFLLGMTLLTDGLKSAAGEALRRSLSRLTGGPFKALLSGVAVTAAVQSSSATTLTTIGFVSAGLLTFPQAIGVIFGANLGTTSTGWIVSIVGLKVHPGALALPLVAAGAMLRVMARGRLAAIGLAIAGFGLLFVGIDMLQTGMAEVADRIDPAALPGQTMAGRLLLVGVGIAMTVVMQSSSAALVTTLTALDGGTIALEQGAALVIGQNLGTTVTAAVAAVGASVPAKRTAVAHIAFNLLAGISAFAVLPLLLRIAAVAGGETGGTGPVTLAAFHTAFNVLGVALMLPFVGRFAAAIERLVPDRGPALTRHLDPSLTRLVPVAVEAAMRTLQDILAVGIAAASDVLDSRPAPSRRSELEAAGEALSATRRFMSDIRSSPESRREHQRHLAALHAADHVSRVVALCRDAPRTAGASFGQQPAARPTRRALELTRAWLRDDMAAPAGELAAIAVDAAAMRQAHRRELLERTARGLESPDAGLRDLDAARWLETLAHHVWRAVHYLEDGAEEHGEHATEDDTM
jgi:phosphate:Na+ symporter